ncbi:hypothetical protein GCM10023323_30020 [Streptomyces thinghirensis]|uniref:Uncharacterized protein n=1 Tax=Streptomyces thinghirensis TaxID=551547 RepID=A0ABP9T1L2_9ACTN
MPAVPIPAAMASTVRTSTDRAGSGRSGTAWAASCRTRAERADLPRPTGRRLRAGVRGARSGGGAWSASGWGAQVHLRAGCVVRLRAEVRVVRLRGRARGAAAGRAPRGTCGDGGTG